MGGSWGFRLEGSGLFGVFVWMRSPSAQDGLRVAAKQGTKMQEAFGLGFGVYYTVIAIRTPPQKKKRRNKTTFYLLRPLSPTHRLQSGSFLWFIFRIL